MATDYVFAGPSLPAPQVRELLPGCRVLPPVRHGDLLRLRPERGDRVLLIDGLFLQSAPVRHKEILLLLAQGVTVAGAASMGALRAAELWPYGMRGVGDIFRLHRDLVVTSDDEVAVIHCSAEENYRPLSEPLVNIRIALREARAAGAIAAEEESRLLALARAIPFRSRGYRLLDQRARAELGGEPAGRFEAWRRAHARDAKADDARLLLRMAAAGDPALRPAGPGDTPVRNAATKHALWWTLRFRGEPTDEGWVSDADVAAATMLLHPGFPGRHRRDTLAAVAGTSWNDPGAPGLALAAARSHGIDEHSVSLTGGWLTPADKAGIPIEEQLARLVVRAYGAAPVQARSTLLANPQVRHWATQVARVTHSLNQRLPAAEGRRARYRADVVDREFARLWGRAPADLEAAAWDRGIPSIRKFRELAEPFVGYLKAGAPLDPPRVTEG
ncbi:MAG: TfuA-like protein [Trebonia sp.]